MATQSKRLSARFVTTVAEPGMHADGDGLYLIVSPTGAKRWSFIFFWQTKRKEMGLGKLAALSLADARDAADEARRLVARGINPIDARKGLKADAEAAAARVVHTFGMEAEAYVSAHASSFRNAKHLAQWRMTLSIQRGKDGALLNTGYCLAIRDTPVDEIDTPNVMTVLQPIWNSKAETASRLRGRIEHVLDAAKVDGHRSGENPARWRGHLDKKLPKRRKLTRGHHAAMPFVEVPAFVVKLREAEGIGALALEFLILTTSRTNEVTGAVPVEFDLDKALWIVPPERMKMGEEHRVPLTPRAVTIARQLIEARTGRFIFAVGKTPISDMTMNKALVTAGGSNFTVHGFRSSFRDWVGDETSFPGEIAEAALAHAIGNETERAYRRGDALAKRRKLMDAWARYCLPSERGNVVPMKRKTTAA